MRHWPYPKIVAHRGGGTLAPENTLAAMRLAHARGFRGVEFDVMLARDAVPVLMHDPVFGRTVGGSGRVDACTAAQLGVRDAGSWFGPQFAGEPVPSFEQVAQFCRASGIWMNVEIKPAPGAEAVTGAVVARLAQRLFTDVPAAGLSSTAAVAGESGASESATNASATNASAASTPAASTPAATNASGTTPSSANVSNMNCGAMPPLLSSFSVDALLAARQTAPGLARALLVDRLPADWLALCGAVGASALHLNHQHLTAAIAHEVKAAGLGLFCYTVNDPDRARALLGMGVDGFCTDRLDLIGPDFPSA